MLFVFGTRRTVTQLAMVVLTCANCHRSAANAVLKLVTRFTLFFIPLFPIRTRYATRCTACGFSATVGKGRVERLRQMPPAGSAPPRPAYGQPWSAPWPGAAGGGTNGHTAPGPHQPGARGG
ncbi:zinc-ribbon domain-containing protein [Actinomycetospora cinnamomea]|uniref:Zinc ribbon family protein n=1 Tax=Actinomycetospora cinnamomea TaxID=663609 RepID=A0A2U1FD83_9PSEU|nr:zinc-ribbon domain-containing protein [Actinomycetospora cinnamomea]PVZ10096.1 zinc ribbon family protein [Actinomycetospora cinnamomea]